MPLRPDWPAVRVYKTDLDFGSNSLEPLWSSGGPVVSSQGLELDAADPAGKTLHLLDEVRLDANDPPGATPEKILLVRYHEGDPASPAKREHRVSSQELGPDRKIVLPSKPVAIDSRYAFFIAPADQPEKLAEQMVHTTLRPVASRNELAQGTFFYDAAEHALYMCPYPGSEPAVLHWVGGRSDPVHLVRGLYTLGGNAYGHQKQYAWGCGLGMPAEIYEDVTAGFSPGHTLSTVPGTVVRDCTFRWCGADVGRGGEVSGDVRHTADRIKRPELHVDHCVFDVGNSFLFDGNDNPTKNIPFANHHIWENNYFLPALCGMQGPWWDQYCFNNVVQNCLFAGPRRRGCRGVREHDRPQQSVHDRQGQPGHLSRLGSRLRAEQHHVPRRRDLVPQRTGAGQCHGARAAHVRSAPADRRAGAGPLADDRSDRSREVDPAGRPLAAAGRAGRGLLLRELGLSLAAADRRPGIRGLPGGEQPGRTRARLLLPRSGRPAAVPAPDGRQPAAGGRGAVAAHSADARKCGAIWCTR